MISDEYRKFLREERPHYSPYEKACNFAERFIKIRASKKTEQKMEAAIKFIYLKISPSGPISLASVFFLICFPIIITLAALGSLDTLSIMVGSIFTILFAFYLYDYPFLKVKVIRTKASTEMILTTLYMAVSLREIPNLENAIKFASQYVGGVVALDLKKILWDLETQKYYSVEPAIEDFLQKWGVENEEFVETVKIWMNSIQQPEPQRIELIDEAITVLLNGTIERMKQYSQDLRLPVMMIYAIGIMLPIISLVLFPIVMIFLSDLANISYLVIGYDILLPIILYFFINESLERKPLTFSPPQFKNKVTTVSVRFGNALKIIPIWFFVIPVFLIFTTIGGNILYEYNSLANPCREWQSGQKPFSNSTIPDGLTLTADQCKNVLVDVMTPTLASSLIIWGIGFSITLASLLISSKRIKIRDRLKKLEKEFAEALYQLGHQMAAGHSIETALEKSKENLKNLEIANFYDKILSNIKVLGMTFENAVFDKKNGALRSYPSLLIRSIMTIVVQSAEKGLNAVTTSCITISKYLKGIHQVEFQINEIMSETTTSMKFLALFLAPLVAGITVGEYSRNHNTNI